MSIGVARHVLHAETVPTRIYLRADPHQVAAVAAVLPFTTSPAEPEAVEAGIYPAVRAARLSPAEALRSP